MAGACGFVVDIVYTYIDTYVYAVRDDKLSDGLFFRRPMQRIELIDFDNSTAKFVLYKRLF